MFGINLKVDCSDYQLESDKLFTKLYIYLIINFIYSIVCSIMKSSRKPYTRRQGLLIGFTLLALVISIVTAYLFLSQTPETRKMTSACAHKTVTHLNNRPDRDVLPTNVVPMKYHLTIKPDMDNFTFEGKVIIE